MEDSQIIDLFFARSEQAICELDSKYGKVCHSLSYNILHNQLDVEECVNDACKRMAALLLSLAMLLLCCACTSDPAAETTPPTQPKLTAAEIVQNMQAAMSATPCSKLETVVTFSMTMDAGEAGKTEMRTESITEMTISQDPVSSYSVATTKVTAAGETAENVAKNYTVIEDGQMVSYVKYSGIWVRMPTGQTPEALSDSASSVWLDLNKVTVDETVTTWNGQSVICLKTALSGETVANTIGSMLQTLSGLDASLDTLDYSKLSYSSVIYLDPEGFLPVAQEITFDGMTDMLAPLYQDTGITIEVTACTTTGTYLSYEPQEAVTLPEGTAEKAEIWTRLLSGDPDNGDGTFTIREGLALINVVHPDGFELKEKDYDHVTFLRDDYRQITYMMSYISGEQTSGEYFLAANDSTERRWNTNGGTVERQQVNIETDTLPFTCDLLATTWGSGREDANFYSWTPLFSDESGTYYLYIEIADGASDGFGFTKSADITSEEFVAYLNAAPSKVTAE